MKADKYAINKSTLTGIAEAVRTRSYDTEPVVVKHMAARILQIPVTEYTFPLGVVVGPAEPASGPVLWFDTSATKNS